MRTMENLTLAEIQKLFIAAIFGRDNIQPLINKNNLHIYQGNISETLRKSLRTLYPNILLLVGKDFFDALADEYAQQYPSTAFAIADYGKNFAEFLADFPHVATLPYLPEMAQLEWGAHEMIHAATDDEAKLFCFRYPIYKIWQLCKDPQESLDSIDIAQSSEKVLLFRRQFEVQIKVLTATEEAVALPQNQSAG